MPTVSDTPRSAGTRRIGRVADAPRSASTTSSSGRRNPLTGVTETRATQEQRMAFLRDASNQNRGAGPAFAPINALLTAVSIPAYAVGGAIRNPRSIFSGQSAIDIYRDKDKVFPGKALQERGVLPGGKLGAGLSFAADVFLDPTTYVSFGGSTAARAATRGAATRLAKEAAEARARGQSLSLARRAAIEAEAEVARAAAPKALSVRFRVPFTRNKEIPLFESADIAEAAGRVASRIGSTRVGENLREVFLPAGAGSKVAHRIGAAARRAGDLEKRVISKQALAFDRAVAKAAKAAGMNTADAYRGIVKHLDKPDKYPVPKGLESLRDDAAALIDDFRRLEDEAGIQRGNVPHYAPHLPASAADRRKLERLFPMDPDRPFFFQKPRDLPDLDAWEALGLQPEYNLARLIEVRGHASVDARVMRAFDEATKDLPGIASSDVERVKGIMRPAVTTHYAIQDTQRFVNQVGASWKALALTSPGYHARNAQSDLVVAYWAGARNPISYVQSARVLAGKAKTVTVRGKTYTAEELIDLAEQAGAIRLGQAGKEIREGLLESGGTKLRRRGLRPSRPGSGSISTFSQDFGEARENWIRLGTFIERLKAGDDVLEAGRITRDFHIDYGDVGRFVRAARRFWMPFITFPSKAIPIVGREALKRPGRLANLNKAITALNEAGGDPDLSLLPEGQRSSFAVPAPSWLRGIIGAPEGQPLLFNPESVMAYGALNQADPTNPMRSLGGLLNPIPKAAVETKTDYSFFFNAPAARRVVAPAVINQLAKRGFPIKDYGPKRNAYTGETVPGYSRDLDAWLRIFPPFSQSAGLIPGGGSETSRLPYLRYFAGLSISPYDYAKAAFYASKYDK